MTNEVKQPDWVSMSKASRVVHASVSKISRYVREGRVTSTKSTADERVTYVDLNELKSIFPTRDQERGK